MASKGHIVISKTATFFTLGNLVTAKKVWFVLHGYGYSAEFFIKKFECLVDEETAVVAPEGLSKFYLKGVDGRVGASWMTKVDREHEIRDYVNYLNELYNELITEDLDKKITVLGFSQGGATACRWISSEKVKIDNFILWASVFPDDMNFESISNLNAYFIYGNKDEFVTEERIEKQKEIIPNFVKVVVFEGIHDIPENVLLDQVSSNNW